MKKILNLFLVLCIICLPSNAISNSNEYFSNVSDDILHDENIPEETKEWFLWFNNLTAYEQSKINYRPQELDKYNYEKYINLDENFRLNSVKKGNYMKKIFFYFLLLC